MSEYCVCCGAEIPEGRMICPCCEAAIRDNFGKDAEIEDLDFTDGDSEYMYECDREDSCESCPLFGRCALVR